jgi:anhydro-N-acetylmuramic acid kinase
MKNHYRVLGLMSGTSLDGLDLALCAFEKGPAGWSFTLEKAETLLYDAALVARLRNAHALPSAELFALDATLGKWMGAACKRFLAGCEGPDCIASHGHTVHHRPGDGFTVQIGHAAPISAACGLPVVYDFRSGDVALGGQGAPLVPIGDALLFGEYGACLNLGGIANVSLQHNGQRMAMDISLCNMLLDAIARKAGMAYDGGGALSARGYALSGLLDRWNSLDYFLAPAPKSLGREFFDAHFKHDIEANLPIENLLRTATEHIAGQIRRCMSHYPNGRLLVTGGGAMNGFLVERIQALTYHELVVPNRELVAFKEALVFAFLGVLRLRGEVNALASVTGATRDSSTGSIVHL